MAKLESKNKLILILLILSITKAGARVGGQNGVDSRQEESGFNKKHLVAAGVGGVLAVIAAPFVLTAVGFTSVGIATGSYAAGMMSTAAIANGGGIAAGSVVAVGQAIGVVGLGAAGTAAVGGAGAAAGAAVSVAVSED